MQHHSEHESSVPSPLLTQLQAFMAAVKDDFAGALDLMSPDIVWINRLPDHVPFGGEYCGRSAVVRYFEELSANFVIGEYPFEQFEFIEAGDTLVMVGYEQGGRAVPTDVTFDLHFVWVVKFDEQGRIAFLQEHNDTAAIGDAFRQQH